MEKKMSALQKLQEKIEQWKVNYESLKIENKELKNKLESIANVETEQEAQIAALKRELEEKDTEIEKIIAQVETLLA
jgi:chromosome segregation ATPase